MPSTKRPRTPTTPRMNVNQSQTTATGEIDDKNPTNKRVKIDASAENAEEESKRMSHQQKHTADLESEAITANDTKVEEEKEQLIGDQPMDTGVINPTNESETSVETTFRPHGILRLPQSIASALASEFLKKREIRDLGVTCRWMLVSLNQCVIHEPVSLQFAIDRLNHTESVYSPSSVSYRGASAEATFQKFVNRIPDLLIGGRFRSVQFESVLSAIPLFSDLYELQIKLFSELYRLRDARTLFLSACHQAWVSDERLVKPIRMPPLLDELIFHDVTGLPPLKDFSLPQSLKRIQFLPHSKVRSQYLTKVRWPSQLRSLMNVFDKEPLRGLVLPESLKNLTFLQQLSYSVPNGPAQTGFILPSSITNLEMHHWEDENGRYRDLPFPAQLRRLVFSADSRKNDLDLTTWRHLPHTCENLQLRLIHASSYKTNLPTGTHTPNIVIPGFMKQLHIHPIVRWSPQYSTLQLTHASSLVALVVDSLDLIEWPTDSKLIRLKAIVQVSDFLRKAHTLPRSIEELDFSHYCSWDCDMKYKDLARLHQLSPPSLKRVVAPWDTSDTRTVVLARLNSISLALPDCFVETHSDNGNKLDYYEYKCGSQVTELHLTHLSEINQWKQRHRARFDLVPVFNEDE